MSSLCWRVLRRHVLPGDQQAAGLASHLQGALGVGLERKGLHQLGFGHHGAAPAAPSFPELSAREREVLELMAAGLKNPAIASRLFLSPKTVRNHVSSIFGKLQVAGRGEAIVRAREAGLGR